MAVKGVLEAHPKFIDSLVLRPFFLQPERFLVDEVQNLLIGELIELLGSAETLKSMDVFGIVFENVKLLLVLLEGDENSGDSKIRVFVEQLLRDVIVLIKLPHSAACKTRRVGEPVREGHTSFF